MVSRMQKGMALRRRLHILRALAYSKSVKMRSIVMDALLHINQLKLKMEETERECLYQISHTQEVKVEKLAEGFLVKVSCKRGHDVLVSILEAFEQMGLNVLQARVSSNYLFGMEAIVEAQDQSTESRDITRAVLEAIKKNGSVKGTRKFSASCS